MRWIALVIVFPLAGCGGDVFVGPDGGEDAALDSPPQDAPNPLPDAAPFECGKSFCDNDQVCIHPCCGGAMICEPEDDGGTCPNGTSVSQTCPAQSPCTYVCVPDPPYCAPANQCQGGQQGHDCYLACG
jgi:hypothetical protein